MKRCTRCGEEKPLDRFAKNSSQEDGKSPYCKDGCYRYHPDPCYCKPCEKKRLTAQGLRKCRNCNEAVPFEDFTQNKSTSDGWGNFCKSCAGDIERNKRCLLSEAWDHEVGCQCHVCIARTVAKWTPKKCTKCKQVKDPGNFRRNKKALSGLQLWCSECIDEHNSDGRRSRWGFLMVKYRITEERFWEMYNAQNGNCACCNRPTPEPDICVDHDHACCNGPKSCGKCIRKLICKPCNTALGLIEDDPERAMALAAYLLEFQDAPASAE